MDLIRRDLSRAVPECGQPAAIVLSYVPLVCFAGDDKTNSQPSPQNAPAATAPVEPEGAKVAHDGSINDIDAIGHRNVGCATGAGNWYSLEKQIAWGKQISQEVESQSKVINDPVISEYVNRVGQNIVRNSDSQVPFTIKVIDSDDVNAVPSRPYSRCVGRPAFIDSVDQSKHMVDRLNPQPG